MAYLSDAELCELNFKHIGGNVKISRDARIYESEKMSIGANVRIDDFCVVSGKVIIGDFCHITPMCLVAGGEPGVELCDYVTLAYGVKVFSQSDDYSGETMTNSLIANKFKSEIYSKVIIESHSIVGANSVIMPGVILGEGVAVGAASLVVDSLPSWGIYTGSPARIYKKRSKNLLALVEQHKQEFGEK